MRYPKSKILFAVLIIGIVAAFGYTEAPDESLEWDQDHPPAPELPPEAAEKIIEHIADSNTKRAEELRQLYKEDPKKFGELIRRKWEEKFGDDRSHRGRDEHKPGMGFDKHPDMEDRLRKMREKHEEYLDWLNKNYPEHSNQLQQDREENPMLYLKKLKMSVDKYGYIYRTADDNPELAELLKKDLELKEQRDSLLREIAFADNKEEKQGLEKQLEDIVSKRYDLIVQRKKLEYEKLLEKLERLKEKVNESKSQVKKWQEEDFKNENVEARLEKLLSENESFNWH